MRKKLLLIAIGLISILNAKAQCGQDINLSTDWSKKGPSAAGNWIVGGGGTSVRQTINGDPTFYVSSDDYIDVQIKGTIRVNTSNDDDFIGFVFGYKNPITPANNPIQKYYLFDWKQAVGSNVGTHEGFALIKVDTSIVLTNFDAMRPLYWQHQSYPGFNVIATDYGVGKGWADFTDYNFTLTYTSKEIIIEINNNVIFHEFGCFEPGKFGFYNLSQNEVIYSNFSYSLVADFDMSVSEACIKELVNFNSVNDACQSDNYTSPIVDWSWDFGDGNSQDDANSTHSYNTPGEYTVTLNVEDATGCISSIEKQLEIKGLVLSTDKTLLCAEESTTITATDIAGANYMWFRNGSPVISTGSNTLLVTEEGNYHVMIDGFVDYVCNETSDTITITNGTPEVSVSAASQIVCPNAPIKLTAVSATGTSFQWYRNGNIATDPATNGGRELSASQAGNYNVLVTAANGCTVLSDILVLSPGPSPSVNLETDQESFCPYEFATITVTTDADQIAWYRNNQLQSNTSESNTVNQAGTYRVTVTNEQGCSSTSENVVIIAKTQPNVNITPSRPNLCPDITSLELTAGEANASNYIWLSTDNQELATNRTITVSTANVDYSVIVTGQNGCSDTSNVFTLITNPTPVATFSYSNTSFCANESVTLTATEINAARYRWFRNGQQFATSTSINTTSNNSAGNITLTVEKDNCTATSTEVSFSTLPLPDVTVTSNINSICTGTSGVLSIAFNTDADYEWFLNNTSQTFALEQNSFEVNQAGTYKATVTAENGCTATSSNINVTQITSPQTLGTISGSSTYCAGDHNVQYTVPNTSGATHYVWSVSPSTSASIGSGQGTNQILVNYRNANTVTITVTAHNICGAGASSSINVNKGAQFECFAPIQFSANNTNLCKGQSVTFNAHTSPGGGFPPNFYRWEFTGTGAPANVNGNTATVTFNSVGTFGVKLVEYADFGGGNVFEVWNEEKANYIRVSDGGTITAISGLDIAQCLIPSVYTVSPFTASSTYAWSVEAGELTSGATTSSAIAVFNLFTTGMLTVVETTASGCTASVSKSIGIECIVDVTETGKNNNIEIYPNPVSDYIIIETGTNQAISSVKIYNQQGNLVLESSTSNGKIILNNTLPQGIYQGTATAGNNVYSFRFLKE